MSKHKPQEYIDALKVMLGFMEDPNTGKTGNRDDTIAAHHCSMLPLPILRQMEMILANKSSSDEYDDYILKMVRDRISISKTVGDICERWGLFK